MPRRPGAPLSRIIYTARVVDTQDPDGLGRVQVSLDGFETALELPWIRQVGLYASKDFGAVFLPEKDDEVIVLQGDSDGLDQMICLGSVYNGARKPKTTDGDGKNNLKELRTRSGHALTFSDEDGKEQITLRTPDDKLLLTMQHADGVLKLKASDELRLDVSGGKIRVDCKDATVSASNQITVEGDSKISVQSKSANISVQAGQDISVKASTTVKVEAPTISLAGSRVELG